VKGEVELVHVRRSAPQELLAVMADLAARRDGWINLQADVGDDEGPEPAPARAGAFALFPARGPDVPVCTWVPGPDGRRGPEPDSVGIQHGSGPRALRRLADAGSAPPAGWRMRADHPKRGLVLELPSGTDPATVLTWIFAASDVLAGAELPDQWLAAVHRR
jgi:hypothetical protein